MDSWDISQGAQDDGCGSVLALKIPQVLKSLSLQPQRSIRTLLNVASEYNFLGSRQYLAAHAPELGNHVGMMLADAGCAKPMGYIIAPNYPKLGCLLAEIGRLFDPSLSNPSIFTSADTYTSTLVFNENRAPSILLNGDAGKYYWLRHTYADTMTHLNRYTLDDILVFWTTTAYVLADMVNKISDL
jgi:Zn-dependent M28 family amino/carboxypeptidase